MDIEYRLDTLQEVKELLTQASNELEENDEYIIEIFSTIEEIEKENKLEKIEKAVKESLEKLQIDKIETELGSIQLAKCPISVEITDIDLIPGEFVKIKMEKQADKTAIKNHFKETGEIIEGASIISTNTSLRYK